MEAITALRNAYAADSDDDSSENEVPVEEVKEEELLHLKPLNSKSDTSSALAKLNANPDVITKVAYDLCIVKSIQKKYCHNRNKFA